MLPSALSIVVVSYNTRDLLRRCLSSVLAAQSSVLSPQSSVQIVVVDNASADGSAEMVAADFPGADLVRSEANLGFARATNLGLQRCLGKWLLLLNPDTEIVGDALAQMVSFLASHPGVAAVGPSLIYPDGRFQHGAFHFPTLWMTFLDFFPTNHRLLDSSINGRYRIPADGAPSTVDHVLGAAMMLRREALEDVGPLDEQFFMYCEEVDWSMRARSRGWKIYQLPSAKVIHASGQSTGQFRDEMLVELWRSRYLLFDKHYSRGFTRLNRLIVRLGLVRNVVVARWDARRGRISSAQLEQRLRACHAIWDM